MIAGAEGEIRETDRRRKDAEVFKAHILLYHSTLGLRVIKKKKKEKWRCGQSRNPPLPIDPNL